ncbi:hypothetical protein A5739_02900 [Mycobacterium colombiense]|uniref:LPO_1073/Vpar_1526 family protein n=1 Tax=Mycobacterium colombiense TaxID=339268 RepID=UPI00096E304F|nr:LPO_1073/Vpar_1526 family protein [Mycobacterium colombiense]OMC28188.1 hypothetical protein A5739_02900 [Mycobacterium colombiense]
MLEKRLSWGGSAIISAVLTYLAWAQVADHLARWSLGAIGGLFLTASIIMFPWGRGGDGSPKSLASLIRTRVRGRSNASLVSGDHSTVTGNVQHTGTGDVTVNHGLTTGQLDELKRYLDDSAAGQVERFVDHRMEAFRAEVVNYTGEAYDRAMTLGQQLMTEFVERLAQKAPENIDSLKTVAMQHAILSAQTSAAVADDEELTHTLVDILIDKSGAEPRGFKGVILSEALEVARKLTADQVNLLTALVIIARTISHNLNTAQRVLDHLDERCRPLYGKIPTTYVALQYMSYTGVGNIDSTAALLGPPTMAKKIIQTYDSVFTSGFSVDELPEGLKPLVGLPDAIVPVDERYEAGDNRYRVAVASAQTLDRFSDAGSLNEPYLAHQAEIKALIQNRHLAPERFMGVVEIDKPDLAQFIRDLDKISAPMFVLSAVGVAIGQANWRRLQPDFAPTFDMYVDG